MHLTNFIDFVGLEGKCNAQLYLCFSVIVIIINKYVLSTLQFTIPTVFQGWQTLVCVLLLGILSKWSVLREELFLKDVQMFPSLFAPIIAFSISSVAGSKGLADLPIPFFLCGTNLVPAGLMFLDGSSKKIEHLKIAGSAVLLYTVLSVFIFSSSHSIGWFWCIIHVLAQLTHILTMKKLTISPIVAIYYCNFGCVIILLPLSVYLQEASSALHHARLTDLEFILGCVMSGVCGTALQIISGHLYDKPSYSVFQGLSKLIACSLSLLFFPNDIDFIAWIFVAINLVLSSFLFNIGEKQGECISSYAIENV